jgi:hypothetical protein
VPVAVKQKTRVLEGDAVARRQQGVDRYHERYRRGLQRYTCIEVMVAAFRRGWTAEQIAAAAGISHQAVKQRLDKYQSQYGEVVPGRKKKIRSGPYKPRRAVKCAACGKPMWTGRKRAEFVYCSGACHEAGVREITNGMVETAILLRWSDETWTLISQQLGYPMQSIQTGIWKYLFNEGKLNSEMVDSIWCRGGWREGYKWLEHNTGLVPTKSGATRGPRPRFRSEWRSWIERRKNSIAE